MTSIDCRCVWCIVYVFSLSRPQMSFSVRSVPKMQHRVEPDIADKFKKNPSNSKYVTLGYNLDKLTYKLAHVSSEFHEHRPQKQRKNWFVFDSVFIWKPKPVVFVVQGSSTQKSTRSSFRRNRSDKISEMVGEWMDSSKIFLEATSVKNLESQELSQTPCSINLHWFYLACKFCTDATVLLWFLRFCVFRFLHTWPITVRPCASFEDKVVADRVFQKQSCTQFQILAEQRTHVLLFWCRRANASQCSHKQLPLTSKLYRWGTTSVDRC